MSCGDITIDSSLDGAECIFENLEPKEFLPLAPTLHCLWSSWWAEADWALCESPCTGGTRLIVLLDVCVSVCLGLSLYSNSVFFKNLEGYDGSVGKFSKHLFEDALSFGGGGV